MTKKTPAFFSTNVVLIFYTSKFEKILKLCLPCLKIGDTIQTKSR